MSANEYRSEQELRTGFTTGACATAGAVAAVRFRCGQDVQDSVDILFPDGKRRRMPVENVRCSGDGVEALVVKDAGDDPDITDKASIRVVIRKTNKAARERDFVETCGLAELVIRGGQGVGHAIRSGLPIQRGKWAINPTPRQMIRQNLEKLPIADKFGRWLLEISIEHGKELAERTLNPVLGIVDGMSILGTSGIVQPCSNKAYIETIRALLKGAAEMGLDNVVFVTGGRSQKAAETLYPAVPDVALIRVGDFIHEAVRTADSLGFHKITVVCMPGKLAKYALGHKCTHAHRQALSMAAVADILAETAVDDRELIDRCRGSRSVRELLSKEPSSVQAPIVDELKRRALSRFQGWVPGTEFELHVVMSDVYAR